MRRDSWLLFLEAPHKALHVGIVDFSRLKLEVCLIEKKRFVISTTRSFAMNNTTVKNQMKVTLFYV